MLRHAPTSSRPGQPEVSSEEISTQVEHPSLNVRDAWATDQEIAESNRSKLIRWALTDHLRAKGYLSDASETPF